MFVLMSQQIKYIRFLLKYPVYKFFKERNRYISNQNFLIIASILVAVVVSLAAIVLKWAIHTIESFLVNTSFLELRYQIVLYPVIGIVLSLSFIRYVFGLKKFDKGLASIIYKINYKKGNIETYHTYAHMVSSAFTVSLGGSVGVEAPIAITGSAIGSNLGKRLFLNDGDRNLLLACGASAGISAIFNCPIGAVIFALEVLLRRVSVPAFVPLLIASATASVMSNIFYKGQLIVYNAGNWEIGAIPYYSLFAFLCGLISVYTIRMIYGIENRFHNKDQKFPKAVVQGFVVGGLILFSPLLYGEGYFVINQMLNGTFDKYMEGIAYQSTFGYNVVFLVFILATLLLKPIAAAFTVSSGGNGGIFAPSLFIGAMFGLFFSRILNLTGLVELNELNFIVTGMAGILSGVVSAPLTGIFMIAEVAGGYTLFVPLMIVSAGSFFVTRIFEPNSIYTKKLAHDGYLNPTPEVEVLKLFSVRALMESDFPSFLPDDSLRKVTEVVSSTRRNVFPVVKRNGHLLGVITMGSVKPYLFRQDSYDKIKASELMLTDIITADINDTLEQMMQQFDAYPEIFYIPVLQNRKFVGFVSKSNLLNKYKSLMNDWVQEQAN
jgi:chloride channel protein, CIC family